MKPYYEDSKNGLRLFHGDCHETMSNINDNFDLVLADPPFGIDFKYDEHDDAMTPDEYGEFLWPRIRRAEALVESGSVFMWQGWPTRKYWDTWIPRDFRVFIVTKGFVQMRKVPVQWSTDPVLFWHVGDVKVHSPSIRDYFHTSSAAWQADGKVNHPCPRQTSLCVYIINGLRSTNVLDPFVGSGTSMIAAYRCGASATGIEKSEKYCEEAALRLEEETSQGIMRFTKEDKPETLSMDL